MASTLAGSKSFGLTSGIVLSPERAAGGVILAFLIFRLILTATLGLGVDESYSVGVAHDLELSYFDHPPLHYWIAHLFMPIFGDGRASRWPFVAIFVATNWALYLLTRHLFGAWAAAWAVFALNITGFFTLAGGWILPDGPLMLLPCGSGLRDGARPVSRWPPTLTMA